MSNLHRVGILLRDSEESDEHNIRIMEYLDERIHYLNDAGYAIAIDIVSDDNLNSFVRKGIVSIPALVLDDDTEYGVNAIITTLAKLEVAQTLKSKNTFLARDDLDPDEAYREKVLKEMMSGEQDADDGTPSTVKIRGQDTMDMPPNDQELAAKMAKYDSVYAGRNKKNGPPAGRKSVAPVSKIPSAKQNVEKLIAKEGYDATEAAFMREIASRLE